MKAGGSGKWPAREDETQGTLPKTNMTPENGWLEDKPFPFQKAYFQGRSVSSREGLTFFKEKKNEGLVLQKTSGERPVKKIHKTNWSTFFPPTCNPPAPII